MIIFLDWSFQNINMSEDIISCHQVSAILILYQLLYKVKKKFVWVITNYHVDI